METPEECSTWWSELPEDLKEEALAWLPWQSLCSGSVCREWNALFASTKFITNQWAVAPPNKKPCLVISNKRWTPLGCMVFSFFTKRWKMIHLSYLTERYQFRHGWLTGSGAGLFLARMLVGNRIVYTISNPVTRTSFELPPIRSENPHIGITRGDSHGGETYKVIMVDRSWNTHRVEWREAEWREIRRVRHRVKIYDSFLKSWRIAGFLPGNTRVKRKRVGKRMVVSEDFLYCKATERHPRRRGVLRFSIRTGLSIFTPMPQTEVPNNMKRKDHLLICGARILIATCILQSDLGSLREIIIWELDGARLDPNGFIRIAGLDTFFSHILVGFDMKLYPPLRPFHFEGVGDLVCMTHNDWELVVTYNLSDKNWGSFPRQDGMVGRDPFISVHSFEPRPDITGQ